MNLLICFLSVVPLLSCGWIVLVGGATPDRLRMGRTPEKFDIPVGRGYNPRHECDEWHCETTPDAPGPKRRSELVHREWTARTAEKAVVSRRLARAGESVGWRKSNSNRGRPRQLRSRRPSSNAENHGHARTALLFLTCTAGFRFPDPTLLIRKLSGRRVCSDGRPRRSILRLAISEVSIRN